MSRIIITVSLMMFFNSLVFGGACDENFGHYRYIGYSIKNSLFFTEYRTLVQRESLGTSFAEEGWVMKEPGGEILSDDLKNVGAWGIMNNSFFIDFNGSKATRDSLEAAAKRIDQKIPAQQLYIHGLLNKELDLIEIISPKDFQPKIDESKCPFTIEDNETQSIIIKKEKRKTDKPLAALEHDLGENGYKRIDIVGCTSEKDVPNILVVRRHESATGCGYLSLDKVYLFEE